MLEVRSPGALTTIQDGIGRPALAGLGVPRGGAADPGSLAVANLLLGNEPTDAALEMTLAGPILLVVETCAVALAGADLGGHLEEAGRQLRPGASHLLQSGSTVTFRGGRSRGIRAYLALPGGIDVPEVLGSASTCLPGRFGGLDGRALRAGDRIAARRGATPALRPVWPGPLPLEPGGPVHVRVTPGPHTTSWLLDDLVADEWTVSPTSSRAGVRLTGRSIRGGRGELTSLPMWWGAVQLPPNGEPIVLLVDAPTVGGYPVVAVVTTADRGLIGQVGAGDRIRFEIVSEAAAREAELERRRDLASAAALLRGSAARAAPAIDWEELSDDAGAWPAVNRPRRPESR